MSLQISSEFNMLCLFWKEKKNMQCGFISSPSWTFQDCYVVSVLTSYPLASYLSALCRRAAQDHEGSDPDLHRAVLSSRYDVRQRKRHSPCSKHAS